MNIVVPRAELFGLIQPHAPTGKTGRPPFSVEALLRIHFMQQWFTLSDPAMQDALHDTPLYCEFARLDPAMSRLPGESTILRFSRLLEVNDLAPQIMTAVNALLSARGLLLKAGTAVDATLIAAPSSTKNKDAARDPEMHHAKKGNQWHFGMKAHIGVDADPALVHTVIGTAANVHDVTQANALLHGQQSSAHGDAGYQGANKRPNARQDIRWYIAMRPGKRRALDKDNAIHAVAEKIEKLKAQRARQGRAPFWSDQTPVWTCQSALQGIEEEYGAVAHAVCVEQFVDGARQTDGAAGMSALKTSAMPAGGSTKHA